MLATVQKKTKTAASGSAKVGYTVEEVFDEIETNLIEAFGEEFKKRLHQEKMNRGLLP